MSFKWLEAMNSMVGVPTRSMFLRNAKTNSCSWAEFGWTQKTAHWYGQMATLRKTVFLDQDRALHTHLSKERLVLVSVHNRRPHGSSHIRCDCSENRIVRLQS